MGRPSTGLLFVLPAMIVLAMLIAVYFADTRTHRWFRIPGVGSLQPSEFAKPALILFLAYFLSRRAQSINHRKTLQQAFVAVAMLAMLVVVADLGTAMVPVITAVIVFWVAGLEWKHLVRVGALGLLLCVLAVFSRGYRLGRVVALAHRGQARPGTVARERQSAVEAGPEPHLLG